MLRMLMLIIIMTSGVLVGFVGGSAPIVVGQVGHAVTLPCTYDVAARGILDVCWGTDQSLFSCENTLIATEGLRVIFRKSSRYIFSSQLHTGDVSLTIKKARIVDTGFYTCRVEIPGLFNDISFSVYLIVTHEQHLLNSITYTTVNPSTAEIQATALISDFSAKPRLGSVTQLLQSKDNMETFILTAVRVGAIIFIPGLIIALMWKLRRFRKYGNRNIEGKRHQQNILHSNMPVETPQDEPRER